jgi:hypothetical protein
LRRRDPSIPAPPVDLEPCVQTQKDESLERGIVSEAQDADNETMIENHTPRGDSLTTGRGTMPGSITFQHVGDSDESTIFVYVAGESKVRVAHSTHPYFGQILQGAIDGDESIVDLFDLAEAAASKFEPLSERVSVSNGKLYLDGEQIAGPLVEQVLRFIENGQDDWKPLVAFFEIVQSNPNEHSRTQLYAWLAGEQFTITQDGLIVGYKGVKKSAEGFESISHGKAIVNGTVYQGAIPNPLGAVVTMPRSDVAHDPATACHTGLHVGTFGYANGFAQGALLEVLVNPRDVVSVPTDCAAAKMRVCRYVVRGIIDAPHTVPVVYDYHDDPEWWGDEDDDEGGW